MDINFEIGQKVKVISDGEVGEVLAIHVTSEGVRYTISSKEVDMQKKEIINGVKHCGQDELEAVEEVESE